MSTTTVPDTLDQPPVAVPAAAARTRPAATRARIESIDGLRGLVMLLMLVDHSREFFFLGHQVSDPMDLATTSPGLFFTRLAAHLCAPVFVALTGLSAWLYGAGRGAGATSAFLLKRGLFLVVLELTVVSFAWTFALPPPTLFLQVIWAIGLSMIALAGLVRLPRGGMVAVGVLIVAGHNLLDPLTIPAGAPGHAIWAVLHERGFIALGDGLRARTSYPVLPWIGVIALGYAAGPWFGGGEPAVRRARLLATGAGMLLAFAVLRALNGYGEPVAWQAGATPLATAMSFLNLTKYPPSLDFLLLTLGVGALVLAGWEGRRGGPLAVLGGAPLFFYVVHLYVLHLAFIGWSAIRGDAADVPSIGCVWAIAALLAPPLWLMTRRFAAAKRRSSAAWMRYL